MSLSPEFEEQITGHAEIRQVIRVPRSGNIAGSYVTDGTVRRHDVCLHGTIEPPRDVPVTAR